MSLTLAALLALIPVFSPPYRSAPGRVVEAKERDFSPRAAAELEAVYSGSGARARPYRRFGAC